MSKYLFILSNAWKDFFQNKFLTVVLIVISFVSILSTLCAGNMAWEIWQDYKFAEIPEAENVVVTEFFLFDSDLVQTEAMVKNIMMSGIRQKPKRTEFCGFLNMVVEWENEAVVCNIQGNTQGLMDIHRYSLQAGSGFEKLFDAGNTCIIRENGRVYKKGINVGDEIEISGQKFQVAGIVRYPAAYGDIFVSYKNFAELTGKQKAQFHALLQYEEEPDIPKIKLYLQKVTENLTECCSGIEYFENYRLSVFRRCEERILTSGMLFLLATVNFIMMIKGKTVLELKRLRIRNSFGASFRALLAENMLRMEGTITLAFLLSLVGYQLLTRVQVLGFSYRQEGLVLIVIWFVYSVFGIGTENLALKKLLKANDIV